MILDFSNANYKVNTMLTKIIAWSINYCFQTFCGNYFELFDQICYFLYHIYTVCTDHLIMTQINLSVIFDIKERQSTILWYQSKYDKNYIACTCMKQSLNQFEGRKMMYAGKTPSMRIKHRWINVHVHNIVPLQHTKFIQTC